MSAKYLVPALALAGSAIAQSSCSAATTTIQSNADASGLSRCSTFSGSIAIATGTTDNIALDGVKRITGSLIATNVTQMTQLSASDLEVIDDAFDLNELTILSSLNFPRLTDVGSIVWEALPALQGLSFSTGVQKTSELNIQNTNLNTLDGINLQVVDTVYIANNPYLRDIEMQLGNVTESLIIEARAKNSSAIFPNLIWANNMTFRSLAEVSLPSLERINGSLGFYTNEFSSLEAANLTNVGGSLSFVNNGQLTNITMPELTTIGGGFQLANNTELETVDGFSKVKTVGGALDFFGNFTGVDLPALGDVRGAFNMQSSGDIQEACDHFKGLDGVVKGKYVCAGKQAKPSGQGSTPTGSSSSSKSSSSEGAASNLYVPGAATGFMGVVAVMFGLL